MICTVCWGKGWKRGDCHEKVTCPACGGSGKVEQTNEEWFCTLSTEEKAKVLYKIAKDDFKELRKLFYGVANDDCDAVAMWLKQPHRKEDD